MNDLPKLYFTMERYLFPLLEEELGELTAKMSKRNLTGMGIRWNVFRQEYLSVNLRRV